MIANGDEECIRANHFEPLHVMKGSMVMNDDRKYGGVNYGDENGDEVW